MPDFQKRAESVFESMSTLRDEDVPIIRHALDDLYREGVRDGMHSAASYVDGNWDVAGAMAEHLHDVADGNIDGGC